MVPKKDDKAPRVVKLEQYRSEAKITNFVIDTGKEQIVIEPPTGERLIEIGETPMSNVRRLLALLCGDKWDAIYDLIHEDSYEIMASLVADMVEHFKIQQGIIPGGGGASPSF